MFRIASALWLLGLVTAVPYATYYLLYFADRDQYALLIILVLFWIFGFWAVVGPLITLARMRALFRKLGEAQNAQALHQALSDKDAMGTAIDMIAAENRLPRFVAAGIYRRLIARLAKGNSTGSARPPAA